ncbi:MAG: alpha/beta hydrolase-fold protein [Saprospiraceae bacterium]
MKKSFAVIVFLFLCVKVNYSQVYIVVDKFPTEFLRKQPICIAGDFNGWNPGKDTLLRDNTGKYSIVLFLSPGHYEYKFTGGSWNQAEGNIEESFAANRKLLVNGKKDTIYNQILGWENTAIVKSHTKLPTVFLLNDSFPIPGLNNTPRIWICLPESYYDNPRKKYNTLYMFDGNNLFDKFYAYNEEWQIDETLHFLQKANRDPGCIVIGIDGGDHNRISQLTPYKNSKYGGGQGNSTLDYLVKTLKPFIDSTYRTRSQRISTAIGGASLGGLLAFYGALTYPEIFSKVLVFSPSFWWNKQIYNDTEKAKIPKNTKIAFLVGGNEEPSDEVVTKTREMYNLMVKKGFTQNQCRYKYFPDGTHSESFWGREFANNYLWLWDK